jgi:hypothetical protein
MFKRKFLRLARMGKAAVAEVIGRRREYLRALFARDACRRRQGTPGELRLPSFPLSRE